MKERRSSRRLRSDYRGPRVALTLRMKESDRELVRAAAKRSRMTIYEYAVSRILQEGS